MPEIFTLPLGSLGANCYIIVSEKGNAAAVDIGGHPKRFLKFIQDNKINLKKILLTHGHFDHMDGVCPVMNETGAEVYISCLDSEMLNNRELSLATILKNEPFKPVPEYTEITEGDTIQLDELTFKVVQTPGHTKGSVCYICGDCIFSGDTLFCQSIGKTDFPGGSQSDMNDSLTKLYNLDGDYSVYPGHQESTTLDFERKNNPFMRNIK